MYASVDCKERAFHPPYTRGVDQQTCDIVLRRPSSCALEVESAFYHLILAKTEVRKRGCNSQLQTPTH